MLDRVDREGEAVVLVDRQVVHLSALAVVLLDACADWTEVSQLVEVAVARCGPTPEGVDPREATAAALSELHDQGLVDLA
ncbi:hypothetical protein [Nostocoides sp. HKS02]|uniref:hypothetical protein n=1 Tax=Nostocoides sp. HKS02 TaxID=1813880 RepID=UPI0018A860AD|nr:hypothetical protein [Tetrasphaera sp. HKS02]